MLEIFPSRENQARDKHFTMARKTNTREIPTLSARLAILVEIALVAATWIDTSAAQNTTGTSPLLPKLPHARFNERTGRRIGSKPVNNVSDLYLPSYLHRC
ncbi:hypothetical protein E2C01_033888 [Portunus trituberculatus]|uniref:Uncharacterized protein n=1 Tax=Portunus trituberculatus TaxID=210409 RepID=A0A5B7F1C4_PORTR|nr:hypothetical protein [Portunus trituberculatus]